MPKKYIVISGIIGFCLLVFGMALADPHRGVGYENVECNSCHMSHNSLGASLTSYATNENLCMSCHTMGGSAANLPFASSDQAVPGVSGTSHRWDAAMPATSSPDNPYGLRAAADLKNAAIKTMLTKFSNVASCSVCHQQHSLTKTPFDPFAFDSSVGSSGTATGGSTTTVVDSSKTWGNWAGAFVKMTGGSNEGVERTILSNTPTTLTVSAAFPVAVAATDSYYITRNVSNRDTGTATSGSTTTVVQTGKTWGTDAWAGYYVKMTSGANVGKIRRITANTATALTTEAFPSSVAATDKYYITSGRHFMRINNVMNDLCVDCHYYRSQKYTSGQDVKTYDGNKKSHPVGKRLNEVGDATQFNAAFLEPQSASWAPQGGTRGELNGGADTNLTNNIVVGIDSRINCLSCHGMHYTDSNSATVDQP